MDNQTKSNIYEQAKEWVLEAGEIIRTKIDDPLTISTKSNVKDLVTQMDRNIEKFFVKKIKEQYDNHYILSEEGFGDELSATDGTVWIIDPIDGTMNFVQQKRNFAISVGVYHDGIGELGFIYNVMDDILYYAKKDEGAYRNNRKLQPLKQELVLEESMIGLNHFWLCENRLVDESVMKKLIRKVRGSRTYGSAALEFAYVAEGIMDGYLSMNLAPWDIAAGLVIVNEVGGITTTVDGQAVDILGKNSVLTCHPKIHQEIIEDYLKKGRK